MSTRRTDSGGLTSGILIVGIFGGSLCCAGQVWAQAASDRRQDASPADPLREAEFSLASSAFLASIEGVQLAPTVFADSSLPLLLAAAPALSEPATSSATAEVSDAEPPPPAAASPVPFDERPLPYDPTSRAADPAGGDSGGNGTRRDALPAPVTGGDAPASVVDEEAGLGSGLGGFGWGLAPLRWGGSVGIQMARRSSTGGASSSDLQEFVNLRGASYIYQPWLAQISGNLNLTTSQAGSSNGASGAGEDVSNRQNANTVTGGVALNLVPNSRFPFSATFDRSDSRTSSELLSNDYTNTRYSMRQAYRPEDGSFSVQGGYDHSTLAFTDLTRQGTDTVDAVNAGFTRNVGPQRIQADANISRSKNDFSGAGSRLIQLNAQHYYQLQDNLSYNSMSSITDTTFSSAADQALVGSHGRFIQLNSYVNWQPEGEEEDIPLFVTAGVRTLSSLNDFGGAASSSRSVGANVSANYIYSPNLSLQANALLTQVTTSGSSAQLFSVLGGGATYSGDPLTFGNIIYNWSANGNASRQTVPATAAGVASSNLTLSGQLSHGLTRTYRLSDVSTVYLTGTQSLGEISDSVLGNATTLTHTAGANYIGVTGNNLQGGVALNVSDTLTTGRSAGHYRFLNLLINGQMQINTHSSAGANLNFQWSASDNPVTRLPSFDALQNFSGTSATEQTKQSNLNIYGSVNYLNLRAFGVRGLRYNADFTANTLLQNDRLLGNASAAPIGALYSLSNRLTYRIGLLDFELKGQVDAVAGRKNALIFFRAYRDFGGF